MGTTKSTNLESTTEGGRKWRAPGRGCVKRVLATALAVGSLSAIGPVVSATPAHAATCKPRTESVTGMATKRAGAAGYWTASRDGNVYPAGGAPDLGSMVGKPMAAPVVGIASTPTGNGYWLVGADGGIFTFGDAGFYGSMGGKSMSAPVVGIASTASGHGYWLVGRDGGIFTFGDAPFRGSMGGSSMSAPVVGMAATPGNGYWLVGADGGVFSFAAPFLGSMGGKSMNAPVVGIASTPTGNGYWLVGADGGIFTFGDAGFYGSTGGIHLAAPVVGIATTPGGRGYWLIAADSGVFSFGPDAPFLGTGACTTGPTTAYVLPVPSASVQRSWLTKPHHDYPAADIPVPTGTPLYATASGVATRINDTKCGKGYQLKGDDGVTYTYCHASEQLAKSGSRVGAGTLIGKSGSTGDATGPHLHFQVKYPAIKRCPQTMLTALYDGVVVPNPQTLPTSGCSN